MTNESSFETYWEKEENKLINGGYRGWYIETARQIAEQAWNHARSYEHEQILETNIIINKGIWSAMIDRIKK